MFSNWLEAIIVVFILGGIGVAIWKGGSANPEGTRALGSKVNGLSDKVSSLSGRVEHLDGEFEELKRDAATTKDVARLEEKLQTVRAEMTGHRELAERTWRSVERIERFLIERGLGGK